MSKFDEQLKQNFSPDADIQAEIDEEEAAEEEWDEPVETSTERFRREHNIVVDPDRPKPQRVIETLTEPIWERQPGEKYQWWVRFQRFRNMGPARSALAVYRVEIKERAEALPNRTIEEVDRDARAKDSVPQRWALKRREWRWDERAQAWDQHRVDAELSAIDGERARLIDEIRQSERHSAKRLLDAAEKMLAFPVSEQQAIQRDDQGNPVVVIVKPAKWTASDIARFLESASKLNRLAADLETDRTTLVEQTSKPDDPVIAGLRERLQRRKYDKPSAPSSPSDDGADASQ
jgi:hypothetical protein